MPNFEKWIEKTVNVNGISSAMLINMRRSWQESERQATVKVTGKIIDFLIENKKLYAEFPMLYNHYNVIIDKINEVLADHLEREG